MTYSSSKLISNKFYWQVRPNRNHQFLPNIALDCVQEVVLLSVYSTMEWFANGSGGSTIDMIESPSWSMDVNYPLWMMDNTLIQSRPVLEAVFLYIINDKPDFIYLFRFFPIISRFLKVNTLKKKKAVLHWGSGLPGLLLDPI